MALGLIATKVGMTQIFNEDGVRVPVTVLKIDDNIILQKRSAEVDGYVALQVGTTPRSEKNVTKPMAGHFKKAGAPPLRNIVEFRCTPEEAEKYEVGAKLGFDVLEGTGSLDVSAVSKGKGYAGVMKRHNFKGFRATHGTHETFRHGGSIGCRSKPGRVFKGQRMAGQMGNERVTTLNIAVVESDPEGGVLLVRGAVPGGKGAVVELRPSSRNPKRLRGLTQVAQQKSKNPMKVSKGK